MKKGISYLFLQRRVIVEYREKIIEMVNKIGRNDVLRYIYIIISDIMKEEKECEKNESK